MILKHAFPIPIIYDNIDDAMLNDTLEKVNKFIIERDFCNPPAPGELLTTYYDDKNFLGKIGAIELTNLINIKTRNFFKILGFNPDCYIEVTSWLQFNQPGSYFIRHDHYGALTSGCIYLQTPENGGDIVFHNPLEARRVTNAFFDMIKFEQNDYNFNHIKYSPKKGDLIMFESWIQHTVQQNKSNENRISIGFNIWADSDVKR